VGGGGGGSVKSLLASELKSSSDEESASSDEGDKGGGGVAGANFCFFVDLLLLSSLFCFRYSSNIPSNLALVLFSLFAQAFSRPNVRIAFCFSVNTRFVFFVTGSPTLS